MRKMCGAVSECSDGRWGSPCNETCSVGCQDNVCQKDSGVCECKPCYIGPRCTHVSGSCNCSSNGVCECKAGWFGEGCEAVCNEHCLNKGCDSKSVCKEGCMKGWHGNKCDKSCSSYCEDKECNRSGTCTLGCVTGWFGTSCDKECPRQCDSGSCERLNGSCTSCHDGYTGSQCNSKCSENCAEKTCSQTDGACQACKVGWFGRNCNISCPDNCEGMTCGQTDGACQACKVGRFGHYCKYKCSKNCEGQKCNQTGRCTEGCLSKMYGESCNKSCSKHCKDQICSAGRNVSLSGDTNQMVCTLDCVSGWFGHDCSSPCPSGCEICTREDGRCSTPGISGLVVWVVLPVIVITLLLIITAFIVARTKKNERFKLWHNLLRSLAYKDTIKISGYYSASSEGTPPLHCDKVQLLSLRQYKRSRGRDTSMRTCTTPLHEFTSPLLPYRPSPQQDRHQHPIPPPPPSYMSSETEVPEACHVIPKGQPGCLTSTEVRLELFRDYVEAMKLNLGLSNQFYDLPFGKLGPCQEAEKSNNAFKNRYRNILPYDHSRVTLQSIENIPDSDYVNANYIHGYGTSQTFIATQGPYDDVMWDFWRMVWEVNCGKIVMLTNLVESRKVKCQQYWPEPGEKMDNDGVVVQSVSQMELPDFTVRNFAVQMKGRTLRTIQQFHYTTWPDKGVPRDVMSLVDFHQSVKQAPSSQSGPIIVHCSAGVGRTGTFIALDYLLAQAKAEGAVDVFECVTRLRHQRMDLIQTEEQYIFLHEALLEALPSGDRSSRGVIRSERGRNDASETITMVTNDLTHSSGSDHTYEAIEDVSRMPKCKDRSRKRMLPEVP